jgi:hypothetical protein
MAADYLDLLTRRDTLLALGWCLAIVGVVMRGLARSSRRDQALRRQQALDDPASTDGLDRTDRHLEKYLPRYATACIAAGLILVLTAFFR